MPLAVIFDDRTDIWEVSSQHHIVKIVPFNYYKDEGRRKAGFPAQVIQLPFYYGLTDPGRRSP